MRQQYLSYWIYIFYSSSLFIFFPWNFPNVHIYSENLAVVMIESG